MRHALFATLLFAVPAFAHNDDIVIPRVFDKNPDAVLRAVMGHHPETREERPAALACQRADSIRWARGQATLPAANTLSLDTLEDQLGRAHARALVDKSPQTITQRNWLFLQQVRLQLAEQVHELPPDAPPSVQSAMRETRELLGRVELASTRFQARVASGQLTQSWFPNLSSALAALGDFEVLPTAASAQPSPFPDKVGRVASKRAASQALTCRPVLDALQAVEQRFSKAPPSRGLSEMLSADADGQEVLDTLLLLQRAMRLHYRLSQDWTFTRVAGRREQIEAMFRELMSPRAQQIIRCLDWYGNSDLLRLFPAERFDTSPEVPNVANIPFGNDGCFQTAFHRVREGLLGQLMPQAHHLSPAQVEGVVPSVRVPDFTRFRALAAQIEGSHGRMNPDNFSLQFGRPTCVANALVNQITHTTQAGGGSDLDTFYRQLGGQGTSGVADPIGALRRLRAARTNLPVNACGNAPAGQVRLVDYEFVQGVQHAPRETFEMIRGLLEGGGQATPIAWINSDRVRDQGVWREYHSNLENYSHAVLIVGYGTALDPETGKPTDYLEIEDSLQAPPVPGEGPVRFRVRAAKFLRDNFDAQGGLLLTRFETVR